MTALGNLDISSLNFTQNCTAVGELFGTQSKNEYTDEITPKFLRLGLPNEYRDNSTITDDVLRDYINNYLYRNDSGFTKQKGVEDVNTARDTCSGEICTAAYGNFSGNPDIAGIGMMVAYILQIFLFTIGSIVHFLGYLHKKRKKNKTLSLGMPTDMLNESRETFLDTTVGFSIPMSIATMIFAASAQTLYELAFATIVPIIAAAPAIPTLTGGFNYGIKRPAFSFVLATITVLLGVGGAGSASIVGLVDRRKYPDYHCDATFFGAKGALFFMGIFPLFYLACVIPLLVRIALLKRHLFENGDAGKQDPESASSQQETSQPARNRSKRVFAFYIVLSVIYGWTGVAILIVLRVGIDNMAGVTYTENAWGFGQVAAVGLWLPVFVEWVHVWKKARSKKGTSNTGGRTTPKEPKESYGEGGSATGKELMPQEDVKAMDEGGVGITTSPMGVLK